MRYSKYSQSEGRKKPAVHPIWRGIGCIFFIITPFVSFAIANEVVLSGFLQRYIRFPRAWMRSFTIPGINFPVDAFWGTLVISFVVMFLFFAIYFTVYAGLYSIVGPSPYGPTDVPPVKRNKRKLRKSR